MLNLKYNDLIDRTTHTSKIADRHARAIADLEKKLAREKAFDLALYNYLQTYGEMNWEDYNCAVAWFEHSDKSVVEIFNEIIQNRG